MSSVQNESFSGIDSLESSDEAEFNIEDMSMNERYVFEHCQSYIEKYKPRPSKEKSTF